MSLTLQGVALFLFIPLVLVLFLRQPLGPAPSVLLGLVVMFGHRFLAAPWARRHAPDRCGWCARPGGGGVALQVEAGGEAWQVWACCRRHATLVARFVSLARRWRVAIASGIFLPLAILLGGTLAGAAGWPLLSRDVNALQFRVIGALTVVSASLGYLLVREPDERLRCPFPLHNLLLLGIRQTLWIFRIVGAWWIVDGLWRL